MRQSDRARVGGAAPQRGGRDNEELAPGSEKKEVREEQMM